MTTLGILAVGLFIVLGGILGFRLHAFVALVLAGLTVSALSSSGLVTRSAQMEATIRNVVIDIDRALVLTAKPLDDLKEIVLVADVADGQAFVQIGELDSQRPATDWPGEIPFLTADGQPSAKAHCYGLMLVADQVANSHDASQLRLISTMDFKAASALGKQTFMNRLTNAMGSYCGSLAILIVMASIIGRCLLDSGAADRIVKSTLSVVGEKNAPAAFVISGFTLSIPVFFDTVFYLMIPLAKALRLRTGGNYLLYVLAIVAGGTMAHSLVPPTPGPLFIAEAFGVSLPAMIVGGSIVGLFSASVAMLYAVWANRKFELKLPEEDSDSNPDSSIQITSGSQPSLLTALIPILLPLVMITAGALVAEVKSPDAASQWTIAGFSVEKDVAAACQLLSDKNVALIVSALFAVFMFVRVKRPTRDVFAAAMQDAVSSAGTIILVTAAGGAFGKMMRQANVAELLQGLPSSSPVILVVCAFLVTAAVRTAQGSATVAMMTAAGIFGGLVTSGAAGVAPLYVALAVGCGSKPISWMNDSGFWVISRMSGMTEKEGLTYITPMVAIAGVSGLGAVILGVIFFP
jgi:gluconate:H+ symporter, GntP family